MVFNSYEGGPISVFIQHQMNKLETPFKIVDDLSILDGIKQAIEGK